MSEFLAYAGEVTNPLPPVYVWIVEDWISYCGSDVIAGFPSEREAIEYANTEPLFCDGRSITRVALGAPGKYRDATQSTDYDRRR